MIAVLGVLFALVLPLTAAAESRIPLSELANRTYLGFAGGLYPGGNEPPPDHRAAGVAFARSVRPLDANGQPSRGGRIVLLSIGMSNTTQEYCSPNELGPCTRWSFTGQALASADVDRASLVIANGAKGGQAADAWNSVAEPNYVRIRDAVVRPRNLTEAQVQVGRDRTRDEDPLPEPEAGFLREPDLRGIRNDEPQSRAVRVRVGLRGEVADRSADQPDAQRRQNHEC